MLATEVCDWIENLVIAQGPRAGENFQLLDWQREFVHGLLDPNVFTAALSIARGNGKSTLVGALAACAVVGPMAVPGAEVVIVAGSISQARIPFLHAAAFLAPWLEEGRSVWRKTDSIGLCEIRNLRTNIRMTAKSSNPDTAHGLAPSLVLCDEPARWESGRSEAMLAALMTAVGKIGGEKIIALGTRPSGPDHWFEQWLGGDCEYAVNHHWAGDDDGDLYSEAAIRAANPSIDHLPALRAAIDAEIKRIRRSNSPRDIAMYRGLRLNQGVAETYRMALVESEEWRGCEVEEPPPNAYMGPCVWGIDLGGNAAMSAIAGYWPASGWLEVVAGLPAMPDLATRGEADGVEGLYLQMAERGELICAGQGRTVQVPEMLHEALNRFGPPISIACDRYRVKELEDALNLAGVPVANLSMRGQGYRDGSEDIRYFERAVADGQVRTPVSLLMRSAVGGCVTVMDDAGNRKIAKGSAGFRIAKHRDDAAVAALQAVAEGRRIFGGAGIGIEGAAPVPAPEAEKEAGWVLYV